jgi:hypothetical protein
MNPNYQRGIIMLAILFFIPAIIREKEDLHKFICSSVYVFIVIHILAMITSFIFLLKGHSLLNLHLMRVLETPPVYWDSGLLLIGLAYLFVKREMNSGLLVIFCILACAGIILGNSRTRFLATFLCLLYFIYPYVNRRLIVWAVTLLFIFSAGLLALPKVENYFSRLVNQRIEQSIGKSFAEMSTGRASAYEFSYNRWKQNPILGVGSCYIFPRPSVINKQNSDPASRVHNYYLEVLAGQGVAGIFLLIIVLLISTQVIFKIVKVKAKNVIDGRYLISLFLFGIINWLFKESWGITYSIIALLSVYSQTSENSQPKSSFDKNLAL